MKRILRTALSPGDVITLTAAVRDLKRAYPERLTLDVRTRFPELWAANPHITPLDPNDPEVEIIDCEYPLVHRSNELPYHFVSGYLEFLNQRLELNARPAAFHGDLHLTQDQVGRWPAALSGLAEGTPYWILVAGGKYDFTAKWWSIPRFQQVVDALRGRVLFVRLGAAGDFHPPLRGVLDLVGKTGLRDCIHLCHHAQGALCPLTAMTHMMAATPNLKGVRGAKPAVVLAGGREPVHWVSYPGHHVLHSIGRLPCCSTRACWRSRTVPLGDGTEFDQPGQQCVDVVGSLPRCMDRIDVGTVVGRIEDALVAHALPTHTSSSWESISHRLTQVDPASPEALLERRRRILEQQISPEDPQQNQRKERNQHVRKELVS